MQNDEHQDCGNNGPENPLPTDAQMSKKEERTSCREVAGLFLGTYLSPFILWIGIGILAGGLGKVSFFSLMLTVYMIFSFPCGLLGLVSESDNVHGLAVLGYIAYLALFILAFKFRKPWQTILLWVALVALLVLNVAGCQHVIKHVTEHMTLP
jgi:hypothetical protein